MVSSFEIYDDELRGIIQECLNSLDKETQIDYLINCLTWNKNKNKTPSQIFEKELEMMRNIKGE
jgi:hypothetical protein